MKKCPYCGSLNLNTSQFCSNCAYPIQNIDPIADNEADQSVKPDVQAAKPHLRIRTSILLSICFSVLVLCVVALFVVKEKITQKNPSMEDTFIATITPELHLTDSSAHANMTLTPTEDISSENDTNENSLTQSSSDSFYIYGYDSLPDTNIDSITQSNSDSIYVYGYGYIPDTYSSVSTQSNAYPGCIDLVRDETVSVDLSGNGTVDTISFSAHIIQDGAKTVYITINGTETSFDLNYMNLTDSLVGVCAADINLSDNYRNILLCTTYSIYVYAYNNSTSLFLVTQLAGELSAESIDGSGLITNYTTDNLMTDSEGNNLTLQYNGTVKEKSYSLDSAKTGILTGTNKNRFAEGFSFTLFNDTEIYEDQALTKSTGIILSSYTTVNILGCDRSKGRPGLYTYHIAWDGNDGWIASPYGL